jgi:hypothetical protein
MRGDAHHEPDPAFLLAGIEELHSQEVKRVVFGMQRHQLGFGFRAAGYRPPDARQGQVSLHQVE